MLIEPTEVPITWLLSVPDIRSVPTLRFGLDEEPARLSMGVRYHTNAGPWPLLRTPSDVLATHGILTLRLEQPP